MFKERLILTGKTLLQELVIPFLAFLIVVAVMLMCIIYVPTLFTYTIIGGVVVVGLLLLVGLLLFIHWLFIEPFKKNK